MTTSSSRPEVSVSAPSSTIKDAEAETAPALFHAVSTSRSYEEVVRQIEHAIRSGQIDRGERLPTERQLGAAFGVSRGVIREAMKVLGAMGLVEARQGSGLYVRNDTIASVTRAFILSVSPDSESVDKLFEFRRGLETEAARFAAQRRTSRHLEEMHQSIEGIADTGTPVDWAVFAEHDNQFHMAIGRASDNPYLEVAIATARDMQQDVVNLIVDKAGSIQSAIVHHRSILEAIREQDPEKAAQAMSHHITYTATAVQSKIPLDTTGARSESSTKGADDG